MLDHIVLATPDLGAAVESFAAQTGVRPARGGSHAGLGTANYLVDLGGAAYLELIGPDPDQPAPAQGRWFEIDGLTGSRIVTWALRTADIDALVASARSHGYDPGEPRAMSRTAPDGEELRWRLTAATTGSAFDGVVPFLIDWGTTPHPTSRGLPQTPLAEWSAGHPHPAPVRAALAALGADLEVHEGTPAGFRLVVDGRHGPVTLT